MDANFWYNDAIELAKFHNATLEHLRANGDIPKERYGESEPAEMLVALDEFLRDNHIEQYKSFSDAAVGFRDWYVSASFDIPKSVTLTYQQTFNTPGGSVTFGMSANFQAQSITARRQSQTWLQKQVIGSYREWLNSQDRNSASSVNAPTNGAQSSSTAQAPQNPAMPTAQFDELPVDRIEKSLHNGKINTRVCGGRWTKFGVPVYPEVLKKCDPDGTIDALPLGVWALSGKMKIELKTDGKPLRVVDLRLDSAF